MDMNIETKIVYDYLTYYDDQRQHADDLALVAMDEAIENNADAGAILAHYLMEEFKAGLPRLSGVYGELFSGIVDAVLFEMIAERILERNR